MQNPHTTPPLPVAASLSGDLGTGEDLPATQAHEILLHCALDAACVPEVLREKRVTKRISELDYQTVARVIDWLRAANSRNF
ncbi:hypothetical protein ACFYPT_35435 [Streptomyces sp. NPDC005529]|uniref:hypothetical protein n=1 Tax=unclassified Streptomyces TaxID=2593676 RepID=UPI0033AA176F